MHLIIPDLWQQEAVRALQARRDVVIHAPTGAGKTYVFELLYPALKGQAIYTVPTRALANDKLAEWQARGWDVGIATGDVAWNTEAKVLVATLETQKGKFLRRTGPRLLVIDEYQMMAHSSRGVHYETAIALAPPETQLLLLSGSVGNPGDIVSWLRRIGRDALLVSHLERPVPLEEVDALSLPKPARSRADGWPDLVGRALQAGLGPVLIFAPRRNASEQVAQALASWLPPDEPLGLSREQEMLAGPRLAKLLKSRVAYHHSGLSYAARAGLIEPLAKNGHLRAVVATMGLAAGINFSMRSVLITDTRYMAGHFEREIQPDELLQMFGRAGRRGLDERGYALIAPGRPRLQNARARHLKRENRVDWPSLLTVMQTAVERDEKPLLAALDVATRLFGQAPAALGIEHSLETGPMPCGLSVDMERARFTRRPQREILNSAGVWESANEATVPAGLGSLLMYEGGHWRRALQLPLTLHGIGIGNLCKLESGASKTYGREIVVATSTAPEPGHELAPEPWTLTKWARKLIRRTTADFATLATLLPPVLPEATGGGMLFDLVARGATVVARLDYSRVERPARRDSLGKLLLDPPARDTVPFPCRGCPEREYCESVEIVSSPAYAWRSLGLTDRDGIPTRRGIIFGFFNHGEGLAVAAALEDPHYEIESLVFDLANLRAGPRFSEEDSPYGGKLGVLCQRTYGRADYPGYLDMGVPIDYGAGASEVVRDIVERHASRQKMVTESLRPGDIERAILEWRSLLRHILWAPVYDWDRWNALKAAAALHVAAAAGTIELPPLLPAHRMRRDDRQWEVRQLL